MKIALVHDYIKEYGGAERVLEALHEIWPDAPIFTTVYLPEFLGPHKDRFKGWNIKTSFLQYLPFKAKLISLFRLIAPFLFKAFDFSRFDVVIVSATGAYSSNMVSKNSALQICYCHTPPRYLYGFATARDWKKNILFRIMGEIVNHFLRLVDFKSAQNVDFFIANSKNVAGRIKKFYRKNSTVIYPPVGGPVRSFRTTPVKQANSAKGLRSASAPSTSSKMRAVGNPSSSATPFFLAGGRIARPKHIDLIVETFAKLKLPLKVFGRSFGDAPNIPARNATHNVAGGPISQDSNISFLGEVTDEEKFELMRNAKAFIFAAEDEDFGITPVEAMSVGTPVIAYRSGGVVESVLEGKTGIFFNELTIQGLSRAIQQFSNLTINPKDCVNHAQKFGKERFKKEIEQFITKSIKIYRK